MQVLYFDNDENIQSLLIIKNFRQCKKFSFKNRINVA